MVKELYEEVKQSLNAILEEHNIEKKPNTGSSTQYLLLLPDEERSLLTIDQVMALYLIDVSDMSKKC